MDEIYKVSESLKEADTNQDQVYSRDEIVAWATGTGGAVLLGFAEYLRRRLKKTRTELYARTPNAGKSVAGSRS